MSLPSVYLTLHDNNAFALHQSPEMEDLLTFHDMWERLPGHAPSFKPLLIEFKAKCLNFTHNCHLDLQLSYLKLR